jgi:hypothetical protein
LISRLLETNATKKIKDKLKVVRKELRAFRYKKVLDVVKAVAETVKSHAATSASFGALCLELRIADASLFKQTVATEEPPTEQLLRPRCKDGILYLRDKLSRLRKKNASLTSERASFLEIHQDEPTMITLESPSDYISFISKNLDSLSDKQLRAAFEIFKSCSSLQGDNVVCDLNSLPPQKLIRLFNHVSHSL